MWAKLSARLGEASPNLVWLALVASKDLVAVRTPFLSCEPVASLSPMQSKSVWFGWRERSEAKLLFIIDAVAFGSNINKSLAPSPTTASPRTEAKPAKSALLR